MKIIEKFKQKYCHTIPVKWWHQYAPSFTVSKKYHGAKVFLDFRDNIDDVTRSSKELENIEGTVRLVPQYIDGLIWDVGAHIGLFTVRVSLMGRKCVAFEVSPKACQLIRKTRDYNHLDFEIVDRAMTVHPRKYIPPISASGENQVVFSENGNVSSMGFQEAADTFGIPALIKMDVEGGEEEFFNSKEFKSWLCVHAITWLVEVHASKIGYLPRWDDVPCQIVDGNHYLYCPDENKLRRLTSALT